MAEYKTTQARIGVGCKGYFSAKTHRMPDLLAENLLAHIRRCCIFNHECRRIQQPETLHDFLRIQHSAALRVQDALHLFAVQIAEAVLLFPRTSSISPFHQEDRVVSQLRADFSDMLFLEIFRLTLFHL